jgi:aspartate 1-decarboxylase
MYINLLKSKIHRATITEANLNYVGSITIDEDLMDTADIIKNEKVQIADINNGNRFETYVIPGERGSGMICLNGATARLVQTGDLIIIMSYALMTREEAKEFEPKIVFVNKSNKVIEIKNQEEHGQIKNF